jgi:hypothetical protein
LDILTLSGLAIRPAITEDLRFVTLSWLRSGERAFVTGRWRGFDHLAILAARVKDNPKTLRALYNLELHKTRQAISEAIARGPTLVVYDVENPTFTVAWACPEYRFTTDNFRKQGLSRALCESLKT